MTRSISLFLTVATALAAVGLAARPAAAQVDCGQLITTKVTLTADVGPCSGDGLIVGADFITIDLKGFRIFGTPAAGDGAGIRIDGRTGVTVKNGSISRFDAGIAITGGSLHKVTKVTVVGNVGGGVAALGDGIVLTDSVDNLISKNTVLSNGPFGGITVIGAGSSGNTITKNLVRDNDVPNGSVNETDGIRIENFVTETTIKGNVVAYNGLDGIALFARATNNFVVANVVRGNGFHDKAHRKGNGITVFGVADMVEGNVVEKNVVRGNASDGIRVRINAEQNVVEKNTAIENGRAEPSTFDFRDDNANCDANTWLKNKGGTFNQPCTGP